ncbi:MFS transporter [Paraflavitalea soli]|nr:MFS transporter [Paraflavitalea soli]
MLPPPVQNTTVPNKWMVLGTVAFGSFMATLDSSIVNIALPTIRRELNTGDNVEWIVLSYLLVTTSTLLIMGRLSDMFGRKRVYMTGFGVFILGSFLCGISWSLWSLVVFRLVQGLGASMIFAIGPAIIGDAFSQQERGKALGLLGTAVAAGSTTGPVAGGLLLQHFGWESIFFVNVPIGLIAIWRASVVLPASAVAGSKGFDIPGALLFLVGVTSLLTGVDFGASPDHGWAHPTVMFLIAAGILLLGCFFYWEKRYPAPLLQLKLFRIKPLTAALAATGLAFIANGSNLYVLPFFLQQLLRLSPQNAGFIMLAGPLTLSIAAPIGGYLSDKMGARWIASAGLLLMATGHFLLSFLHDQWTWHDATWRIALMSLGFGFFQSPNSSSALNSAPVAERGIASSLIAFMRNLGLVFGISLGATVWYATRNSYSMHHLVSPESIAAQIDGMQMAYRVTAGLILITVFISLSRGSNLLKQ